MKELKIKDCIVKKAEGLTADQKKEFIIKDNSNFGEWDWELISNDWDAEVLEDWGVINNENNEIPYNPGNKEKEIGELELLNECPKCNYKW